MRPLVIYHLPSYVTGALISHLIDRSGGIDTLAMFRGVPDHPDNRLQRLEPPYDFNAEQMRLMEQEGAEHPEGNYFEVAVLPQIQNQRLALPPVARRASQAIGVPEVFALPLASSNSELESQSTASRTQTVVLGLEAQSSNAELQGVAKDFVERLRSWARKVRQQIDYFVTASLRVSQPLQFYPHGCGNPQWYLAVVPPMSPVEFPADYAEWVEELG